MSIIILCDKESCKFNQLGWESISFKRVCSRYTETGFTPNLYGTDGAGIHCGNEVPKLPEYKIEYGTCVEVDKLKGVM